MELLRERVFAKILAPPMEVPPKINYSIYISDLAWCREGDSNPHGLLALRILSPLRLPIPPSRLRSLNHYVF